MKKFIAIAALAALAGCSNSSGPMPNPNPNNPGVPGAPAASNQTFQQIERWGRPLTKEVFQMFKNHDGTNRSNPPAIGSAPEQQLASEIQSFSDNFRSPQYGKTLAAILIPDEMVTDLSQSGPAAYLGVETKGATGGTFGGRKPADDVVDISAGALFGKTLSTLGLVSDDGKSIPCLSTDNVNAGPRQQVTSSFPYLQPPT